MADDKKVYSSNPVEEPNDQEHLAEEVMSEPDPSNSTAAKLRPGPTVEV